jgi:predicted esterase YcpF (UPF0227 family)
MYYYIHGYLSEPNSTKGMLLKEKLEVKPIKYRDCQPEELVIADCVKQIINNIKNDPKVVLIGSSLGGLLAAKTANISKNVKTLILLNPAIIPPNIDISKIQGIPQSILKDMQDERLFNEKIISDIYVLVGIYDYIVPNNWAEEFAKAQDAIIKFYDDDHSFTQNINNLPSIISNILNEKDYE